MDCFQGTGKLGQHVVAQRVDDAAIVLGDHMADGRAILRVSTVAASSSCIRRESKALLEELK